MPMGSSSIRLVGYYLLCTIAEKSRKGTTFFSTYQIILLFFCLTTKGGCYGGWCSRCVLDAGYCVSLVIGKFVCMYSR
jgi:hypothetical protein